jgi:hypothetical protein
VRLATTAVLVALLALTLTAAPAWLRVVTPHFVVSGDVDAGRLRDLAVRLEEFRQAIARLLPGAHVPAFVPTFLVVFDNEREFASFKPRYRDKPVPVSGYVVNDPFTPCIALRLDRSADSDLTAFHEYAHLLLHSLDPFARKIGLTPSWRCVQTTDGLDPTEATCACRLVPPVVRAAQRPVSGRRTGVLSVGFPVGPLRVVLDPL